MSISHEMTAFVLQLDSICTRNQQAKDKFPSDDALIVTNAANLARDINRSSCIQELLVGDQASLDYMLSCVHRPTHKNEELRVLFDRSARLAKVRRTKHQKRLIRFLKISSDLHEIYIDEEQRLKDEWNQMCRKFEEKFAEGNERLSKKFYKLFKEQSAVHYDDVSPRTYATANRASPSLSF